MKNFDVIIVGGGPAGLRCAEILCATELKVLLLEKETGFGDKICAGGLTRKDLSIIHLPKDIIEHSIVNTGLFSRRNRILNETPVPIVFTVDRKELGEWQRSQIKNQNVCILSGSKVTRVKKKSVIVNDKEEFGFRFLVGADGYNSIVRKHLGLPQEKRLIGIQYQILKKKKEKRFEIHFHSRYFKAWYGWVFPHKDYYAVGCCADPTKVSTKKLKRDLNRWLDEKGFDLRNAIYESAPISYDYRGIQFGNIFLTGDAGGFGSALTGEGIYQSLVSGEASARLIMDPNYDSQALRQVIYYNRIQERIMKFLWFAGPLRGVVHEIILLVFKNKRMHTRLNRSFS